MLEQILTVSFMTAFLAAAVRLAVPLMYGGIGEIIAEKSGILNIGMEGVKKSDGWFTVRYPWRSGCQSASRTFEYHTDSESVCQRPGHQYADARCHKLFI